MTGSANRLRKWSLMISALLVFCLALVSVAPAVLAADTIEIATEAYIYGYPLVGFAVACSPERAGFELSGDFKNGVSK